MFLLLETSINERFTTLLVGTVAANAIYHLYEPLIGGSEHFKVPTAAIVRSYVDSFWSKMRLPNFP